MEVAVEKRWTQVGQERIRYAVAGTGAAVVLLHGNEESHLDWSWVLPALARSHRVYALDLPGFGDSDKPAGGLLGSVLDRLSGGLPGRPGPWAGGPRGPLAGRPGRAGSGPGPAGASGRPRPGR